MASCAEVCSLVLQVLVETTGGAKYTAADSQRMLKDLNLTQQVRGLSGWVVFICPDCDHEVHGHAGLRLRACMSVILARLSRFVQHDQAAPLEIIGTFSCDDS